MRYSDNGVFQSAGECFAPSQAGLKPLEQPEPQVWKMKGPPASMALRPKSDFLKEVSGTPAQTALGPTSPKKDLPGTVVKSGIGRKDLRP